MAGNRRVYGAGERPNDGSPIWTAQGATTATVAVVAVAVNLHAIDAGVLERALRHAALIGLVVLAATAAVPFTGLVTERGEARAIGLRAVAIGLLIMAGAMAAWNIVAAVHRLWPTGANAVREGSASTVGRIVGRAVRP